MTLIQKISAYTLGILNDKDLPDIAMAGLEEGYDSESLRILAGHNSSDNAFQLVDYFNASLKELMLTQPDRKTALISVIKGYSHNIVDRKVDPYIGFERIQEAVEKTEFYYDDINLMNCYADYISIWEVKSDGLQLHLGSGLTKEQYVDKTKEELIIHLKNWVTEKGGI